MLPLRNRSEDSRLTCSQRRTPGSVQERRPVARGYAAVVETVGLADNAREDAGQKGDWRIRPGQREQLVSSA